jgi:probable FeS assembly SUF system protein SufT
MSESGTIKLKRDCEAVQIPAGTRTVLPAGSEVFITQSLGGTYTVSTYLGLARIAGKDADALGLENAGTPGGTASDAAGPGPAPAAAASEAEVEKAVWDQLRTVYDPEIPVNIVDLGLVYLCRLTPNAEGGFKVEVTMTLTAPGCGMGDILRNDAHAKIAALSGVKETEVKLVVEPPWSPALMSEAARLQLGMF